MFKIRRFILNQWVLFAFVFTLISCISKKQETIVDVKTNLYPIIESVELNNNIERLISPYRDSLNEKMSEVIGFSDQVMLKGFPEGLLGNFICDLMLEYTKSEFDPSVDFALTNNGGLRNIIPKDSVRLGNVFELMPFDNLVIILELDGDDMTKLFNYIITNKNVSVSGLELTMNESNIIKAMINDESFNKNKTYKIVTSDYLANGGDNMVFFKSVEERKLLDILLRDMIKNYIQEQYDNGINLKAKLDGRIEIVE